MNYQQSPPFTSDTFYKEWNKSNNHMQPNPPPQTIININPTSSSGTQEQKTIFFTNNIPSSIPHHTHHCHHHHHQHQQPPNTMTTTDNSKNPLIFAIKVLYAIITSQLSKLPISSRYVHRCLLLNIICTIIGFSPYISLCIQPIIHNYQIWRLFLYPMADANVFLCLLSCVLMNDLLKRLEYYFGSIWTLYLIIFNWIMISFFTLFTLQITHAVWYKIYGETMMYNFLSCAGIGWYPLIFSLLLIESALHLPSQIHPLFGYFPMRAIFHPFIYCVFYCIFIRFDIACVIGLVWTCIVLYCMPCVYHLSDGFISYFEHLGCIVCCLTSDEKFISVEEIDNEAYAVHGKYISRKRIVCNGSDVDDNSSGSVDVLSVNTLNINMSGFGENGSHSMSINSDREDLPLIFKRHGGVNGGLNLAKSVVSQGNVTLAQSNTL